MIRSKWSKNVSPGLKLVDIGTILAWQVAHRSFICAGVKSRDRMIFRSLTLCLRMVLPPVITRTWSPVRAVARLATYSRFRPGCL